jgi:Sortase family.
MVSLLQFVGDKKVELDYSEVNPISIDHLLEKARIKNNDLLDKVELDSNTSMRHWRLGKNNCSLNINIMGLYSLKKRIVVYLVDKHKPQIFMKKTLKIPVNTPINVSKYITVKDNFDGEIPLNNLKITGYNMKKIGRQEIHIVAKDSSNNKEEINRTINVVDQVKPVFHGIKDTEIFQDVDFDPLADISVTDNYDNDLLDKVTVQGTVNTHDLGSYLLSYTVQDSNKNSTKMVRKVTVKKKENILSEQTTARSSTNSVDDTAKNISPQNTAPHVTPNVSANPISSQLIFQGVTVPFIDSTGATSAPDTGCGTWVGSGDVDDNAPTYFIGHNPGDFSPVLNLVVGSAIEVYDRSASSKVYHVTELIDIDDYGNNINASQDNITDRALYAHGEQIALQTCLSDTINRVVIAK